MSSIKTFDGREMSFPLIVADGIYKSLQVNKIDFQKVNSIYLKMSLSPMRTLPGGDSEVFATAEKEITILNKSGQMSIEDFESKAISSGEAAWDEMLQHVPQNAGTLCGVRFRVDLEVFELDSEPGSLMPDKLIQHKNFFQGNVI